jgi:hypothetical protein
MYASRCINSKLWNEIPSTDVRKGWWLDANLHSPIVNANFVKDEVNNNKALQGTTMRLWLFLHQ